MGGKELMLFLLLECQERSRRTSEECKFLVTKCHTALLQIHKMLFQIKLDGIVLTLTITETNLNSKQMRFETDFILKRRLLEGYDDERKLILSAFTLEPGVASALQRIQVEMTGEWIPELGWAVTCTWKLPAGDQLQSVRLYDNDLQFMIYRPEKHGSSTSDFFRAPETLMRVDCNKTRADVGQCVLNIEPYKPPSRDYVYTCEVSGERPLFRISTEKYTVKTFVPPEVARLNVSVREQSLVRVMLNCTTAGLPAPSLIWSVENQKVPEDFSGRTWNATTKLWHVWSTLSPNLQPGQALPVNCTPEVTYGGQLTRGTTAEYVLEDSGAGSHDPTRILTIVVTIFTLLR